MHKWKARIGIEVHAQVQANSKLFSHASTKYGNLPNSQVNLFDLAVPGTLPMLNEYCVEQAVKTALGIEAEVCLISTFDRKHYIYPDIPAGYQITQFHNPIAKNGRIFIHNEQGQEKIVRIRNIQLEQDAGKIITAEDKTFIDFNRAGIALMEIISEADIATAEEASQYVENLRNIMLYLGTCDGNMQEGSLRADVNVSIYPADTNIWGTRCEIKNLNSLRFLKKAIKFEIERQIAILESGEKVQQQTMLFDEETGQTKLLRSKENAIEYLYLPDPNLPCLTLKEEWVDNIRKKLVELPKDKFNKYVNEYKLTRQEAKILTEDFATAKFFEEGISLLQQKPCDLYKVKQLSNWITSELFAQLNIQGLKLSDSKISPEQLVELVELVESGSISNSIAKQVFVEVFNTGKNPINIVEEQQLQQISDTNIISSTIKIVLQKFDKQVQELLMGKQEIYSWLVGQIMKEMKGKGNPKIINQILTEKLKTYNQ